MAVTAGVFVEDGRGIGVSVAGTDNGVLVDVNAPDRGVALNTADIVCAAAVPTKSSLSPEGRLHAPRNKARIMIRLNRHICFFIFFSFAMKVFYRRLFFFITLVLISLFLRVCLQNQNRSCENSCFG